MLRDYQIEMKTRLMEAWKAHRSVMVQMPTGTGKTHLLASVVSEFVSSAGSGVWLIAHRRELVAQMEETLAKYGIRREDTPVRVMAVQWLSRHWNEAGDAPGLIKAGVCQYMRVAFFVHRVDGVLCEDVRWQSAFPMPPHGRWRLLL